MLRKNFIRRKKKSDLLHDLSGFNVRNMNVIEEIPYNMLTKPIKKVVYNNKLKQISRKFNTKRSKHKSSVIQTIINGITKGDINDNKINLERYLQKGEFTKDEYDFYSEIMKMRYYNKGLTMPKTLCNKPIKIYYYCDGEYEKTKKINESKGSYFTNDLLFWAFKFDNFLMNYYYNSDRNQKKDIIDECIIMKDVSIISKNFKLNNKEVISGYIQDFNPDVSFVGYAVVPKDIYDHMLEVKKMDEEFEGDKIYSQHYFNVDGKRYYGKSFDEYILIYSDKLTIQDVNKIVDNQKFISKENDKFMKGLKINDVKEGIYYLEIPKISLTNFCPSVLQFSVGVEVVYSYLITCEVNIDRMFEKIYDTYYKELSKEKVKEKKVFHSKNMPDNLIRKDTYKEVKEVRNKRKKDEDEQEKKCL